MTTRRHIACLAAALLLSACGGGGDDTNNPQAAATDAAPVDLKTVRQVIDPVAGGSVRADGLALDFPAAALGSTAKEVALVTRSAASGAIASFRLEPAGQRLKQPVTLTYTADTLPANARFFWNIDGALTLMPGKPAGNALSTTITSLGYAAGGKRRPLVGSALMQRLGADGRSRALADGDTGGNLEVRLLQCEEQAETLRVRLNATDWQTDADRAIALHDELVALRESCNDVQLRAIEQRACSALTLAVDNATVFAVTSMPAFKELVTSLHAATAMVQTSGATCDAAGGADPETRAAQLIEAKFDQLLSFVEARVVNAGLAGAATQAELAELMGLEGDCERLGLEASCARIAGELYPRVLDILRSTAFDACRATGAPEPSRLHALGQTLSTSQKFFGFASYGPFALETDAMYCTNPGLSMKVFRAATTLTDEITARAKAIDALGSLNEYKRSATIKVPPNGSLGVAGRVQALRCADGTFSNAELVFRINGRELVRYPRNGDVYTLATQPLAFFVERDLARVGLPTSRVDTRTLTLVREGGGCEVGSETVFNQPFTLFSVALDLSGAADEPPPVVSPPVPVSEWAGTVTLAYEFEVSWDETHNPAPAINCGFVNSFAPCTTTSKGVYTGKVDYELAARTRAPIVLGAIGDVAVTAGTVSGTLGGGIASTRIGSDNACVKSSSGSSTVAGQSNAARALGFWRLQVGSDGLFELANNSVDTTMVTTAVGGGTSEQSPGCGSGAPTTPFTTPPTPFSTVVHLNLAVFTGTVDPGSDAWQGSQTLRFQHTGSTCESFIVDTPAQGPGTRGVTNAITCNATLKAIWDFRRQ